MSIPKRQTQQAGRHARVDGIPFVLPVNSEDSPALMAGLHVRWRRGASTPARQ